MVIYAEILLNMQQYSEIWVPQWYTDYEIDVCNNRMKHATLHCTTMRDRKDVWIYLFVYCIDNLIKGYSNYFYISMKNLRSDINVEINTPREH